MSLSTPQPSLPSAVDVAVSTLQFTGSYQTGDLNLPSLVTIFTPKPDCSGRWVLPSPGVSPANVYSTSPYISKSYIGDPEYLACQPLLGQEYYKPGVCPMDRYIASLTEVRLTNGPSSSTYWNAYCCPRGMTVPPGAGYTCYSSFNTPLTAFAPLTVSTFGNEVFSAYWWPSSLSSGSLAYTTKTNATLVSNGWARADAIWIGWEAEDLSKFPPAYAASLAKRIGVPFTPTAVPTNSGAVATSPVPGLSSNLPQETTTSDSGGLGTGAKAGIGVGAAIVFILILGLVAATLLLLRKRGQRRRAHAGAELSANSTPEMEAGDRDRDRKTYLGGQWRSEAEVKEEAQKSYLGGQWRSEAEVVGETRELDSKAIHVVPGPPAELDAGPKDVKTSSV